MQRGLHCSMDRGHRIVRGEKRPRPESSSPTSPHSDTARNATALPSARAAALVQGKAVPSRQKPSLAKRAMRNPAPGGSLAQGPAGPSNAQESSSVKSPPNIILIFPEGWSSAEGFRNPEYEIITKKDRLSAWIAPPVLPISTRELELSAR
jgi:hypothetical protein